MGTLNPNGSATNVRRSQRSTLAQRGERGLEPGGWAPSERELAPPAAAGFEDFNVELRKVAPGRWALATELDLSLGPSEPASERLEPAESEYRLDAEAVRSLLATREPARARAQGAPWKFDRTKLFQGYEAAFSKLSRSQREGLDALLSAAEGDAGLTDLRWLAYMLATVQHECAGTWRAIEEYGKGKGRPYGKPVTVVDPQGKKHRNVYYGRGYVQLTWKANYERMGKLLGNRLLYEPELALQPAIAYQILSLGMRRGLFTGKKLADYIRPGKADYVNARRIVNALDKAQKIAKNATQLEKLLRRSQLPAKASAPAEAVEPVRPVASAAAPSARFHEESAWLSLFEGSPRLRWDALDLNRQAAALRRADGFNIPAKHEPQLWQWTKADAATLKWRPQGITGSREAGSPERPRWFAVSWYGRAEEGYAQKGVRISLVDCTAGSPSFLKYRHVLLVQDARNIDNEELWRLPDDAPPYRQQAGFAPVPIHAGGIAWVGDLLYVADTTLGLRVFDLTRLYEAQADPSQSRCGQDGEQMHAFNYHYVLPQIGYYRTQGTAPHSFVSVGDGQRGRCLWTGQYLQKAAKRAPLLFGWPLQQDQHLALGNPPEKVQPDDSGGRAYNLQGAYRAGGSTWLSVTGRSAYEGSTARLISQAGQRQGLRWRWPHGAEDLYLEADSHTLWCLTEYTAKESPGERVVFGVSLPTYASKLHPKSPERTMS